MFDESDADALLLMTKDKKETALHAMLLMLGANEAIKQEAEPSLGSKVFYRLLFQHAKKRFMALGGKIDDFSTPPTLTLPTRPELTFYEKDVEAMRQLVAEFDARSSTSTK